MTSSPPREVLPTGPAWFYHRRAGERRLGIADPDGPVFFDCGPRDELAMLAAGGLDATQVHALTRAGDALDPSDIVWDVPIRKPGKILCLGKNFAAHAREFGAEVPEEPIFFTKLPDTLLPHEGTVLLPHWLDSRIDHEIELAVILGFKDPDGRGRKYVEPERAFDLVEGYTLINDVTARTIQGDDRGAQKPWLRSKSFDTFCPFGPWVVARGELLQAKNLAIDLWVNDEHRQSSRTGMMVVDVPHAIAYLSRHTTLHPGDVIAMGTPEGVGPIADGDVMVGAIEGMGLLRNPVAREATPS